MITSIDQLDFSKKYTYADYVLWQFKERIEIIKGFLFPMSAPNVAHQRISGALFLKLGNFLWNNPCDVFTAPFDVRLPLPKSKQTSDKIDTVVQPDLCIICDQSKLDKQGCIGAPDLIVEIPRSRPTCSHPTCFKIQHKIKLEKPNCSRRLAVAQRAKVSASSRRVIKTNSPIGYKPQPKNAKQLKIAASSPQRLLNL